MTFLVVLCQQSCDNHTARIWHKTYCTVCSLVRSADTSSNVTRPLSICGWGLGSTSARPIEEAGAREGLGIGTRLAVPRPFFAGEGKKRPEEVRHYHVIAMRFPYILKPRRRVFQGTFFLLAYVLTSSDKTFRSKTRRKPLCLYLKIADKVTDLLLRSGRTPKLSVSGNLRNT